MFFFYLFKFISLLLLFCLFALHCSNIETWKPKVTQINRCEFNVNRILDNMKPYGTVVTYEESSIGYFTCIYRAQYAVINFTPSGK